MEEKKGIEVIEKDIDILISVTAKVLKALDDGKISVGEGFGLAMELPKVWKGIKNSKELIAEIKDLDPEESKLVIEKIYNAYEELVKEE